tara:strand:- start:251 stop:424 length:174 start_codon:yes stop_codon:yes gene_type:complete
MQDKISLDSFLDYLGKVNIEFTDYILEDWEAIEDGNTKLEGMTKKEWLVLYKKFLEK